MQALLHHSFSAYVDWLELQSDGAFCQSDILSSHTNQKIFRLFCGCYRFLYTILTVCQQRRASHQNLFGQKEEFPVAFLLEGRCGEAGRLFALPRCCCCTGTMMIISVVLCQFHEAVLLFLSFNLRPSSVVSLCFSPLLPDQFPITSSRFKRGDV